LPPPDRTDIAQRWLRWADEDLALAEHSAADADVVARGAGVWAHQAAEKAVKALLILREIDPPKLHDLDRLAQRLPDGEGSAFATIELPELTRRAIEGRYPTDLDEAAHTDATKAIAVAPSSARCSSSPHRRQRTAAVRLGIASTLRPPAADSLGRVQQFG
jgi:HEPN domain-containing protein